MGKLMTDWGSVLVIETQERIYYALAGNIAINNRHCDEPRRPRPIPTPNYFLPSLIEKIKADAGQLR